MTNRDLFSTAVPTKALSPLAARMRPKTIGQYIGQEHILAKGKLLRRAIETDAVGSILLYGPPGTGKTTLAHVISNVSAARFIPVSATSTGVAELKRIISESRERRQVHDQRTMLFVDEIQRLNKGQQDVLLPAVEEGDVVLIAATTENPFFEVNRALLSRMRIFRLHPLSDEQMKQMAKQALEASTGLQPYNVDLDQDALEHLINASGGDGRVLLNALESAAMTTSPGKDGRRRITARLAEDAVQSKRLRYDKTGDEHYDTVSAFIKSMRGSDPDAALYWYARMEYANEDPRFIVRRLIVHASEDVGLADPTAMLVAHAAANALEWVGMPEARIPIAQAILHIAAAPKSNSVVTALGAVTKVQAESKDYPVPDHLRDSHYSGAKELGSGQGYQYPHDFPQHFVPQQYLPRQLENHSFYQPGTEGMEKEVKERLSVLQKKRKEF